MGQNNNNHNHNNRNGNNNNSNNNNNKGQSNLAVGFITANWVLTPTSPLSVGRVRPLSSKCYLWPHKCPCDPAKWHLILSSGFSRVHDCERRHTYIYTDVQTDRPCQNRQNYFMRCRLIIRTMFMVLSSYQSRCMRTQFIGECRIVSAMTYAWTKPIYLGCEPACTLLVFTPLPFYFIIT